MAIWVWSLKEPIRGASEGLVTPEHPEPFKSAGNSFMSVLPGFSIVALYNAGGLRAVAANVVAAGLVGLLFYALHVAMPTLLQWVALGIGCISPLLDSLSKAYGPCLLWHDVQVQGVLGRYRGFSSHLLCHLWHWFLVTAVYAALSR